MTIIDIIQNSEMDTRHMEYEICLDGSYVTEFHTYRLTHVIAENLVIVSDSHTRSGNFIRDYMLYLESGTWNEIHQSCRHHSVVEDLRTGAAYDNIRLCVGGRRFADEVRGIVENSGILNA